MIQSRHACVGPDQVALPDLSAAAMENWGLITYRETSLLYSSSLSSATEKEHVATIISHELAHMVFHGRPSLNLDEVGLTWRCVLSGLGTW